MANKDVIELKTNRVRNTYGRVPVALVKGKGVRVWDADGREYLDFASGLAVCNLGIATRTSCRLKSQAETLIHVSNLYHIEPQARLAEMLTKNSRGQSLFRNPAPRRTRRL